MEDVGGWMELKIHGMPEIKFSVNMDPVSWGRVIPVNMGKFVKMVTPEETRNAQRLFRTLTAPYLPEAPLKGPLFVVSDYYVNRPKSVTKKKRLWPCVKNDLDNFTKLIFDAMNTIHKKTVVKHRGFWWDDSQVCGQLHWKRYAEEDEERIEVSIYSL